MSPNDATVYHNLHRGFEPTTSMLDWSKNVSPLHSQPRN